MVVLESMNSNVECLPSSEQLYPTMSLFNSVNEPYIIPPELSELDPDYHSSFTAGPSMLVTRKITSPSSVKSQSSKRAHNSDDHEKSSPKRVRGLTDDSEDDSEDDLLMSPMELTEKPYFISESDTDNDDDYTRVESDSTSIESDTSSTIDNYFIESSENESTVPEFDFIPHQQGGWVIDSAEAKSKWKKFAKKIGWSDEWLSSDLYYP
jgi:predicted 3-demethylubiquinone-9 3-methyltransferase (glyoxalase superfamily)